MKMRQMKMKIEQRVCHLHTGLIVEDTRSDEGFDFGRWSVYEIREVLTLETILESPIFVGSRKNARLEHPSWY